MKLKQTGFCELIEGNYWGDTFWGVDYETGHNSVFAGSNHLGIMYMILRDLFSMRRIKSVSDEREEAQLLEGLKNEATS